LIDDTFPAYAGHPITYLQFAQAITPSQVHSSPKLSLGGFDPALPDFLIQLYQNGKKYAKRPQNVPNGHKLYVPNGCQIFQMANIYGNIFHSKALHNIYTKWDFWFENITSGKPCFEPRETLCRNV
jgi:hypothetical protein